MWREVEGVSVGEAGRVGRGSAFWEGVREVVDVVSYGNVGGFMVRHWGGCAVAFSEWDVGCAVVDTVCVGNVAVNVGVSVVVAVGGHIFISFGSILSSVINEGHLVLDRDVDGIYFSLTLARAVDILLLNMVPVILRCGD